MLNNYSCSLYVLQVAARIQENRGFAKPVFKLQQLGPCAKLSHYLIVLEQNQGYWTIVFYLGWSRQPQRQGGFTYDYIR